MIEELYHTLPGVHRARDMEQGEILRALLLLMQRELHEFDQDLEQLYDNWFVETCEEWAAPYLGDLLGIGGLHPGSPGVFSLRPFVANSLAYRRRKGTAMVLEQLAKDVTGWNARVVEFFRLTGDTIHANHTRRGNSGTLNINRGEETDLVHGPFEANVHTVDTRSSGRYHPSDLGIFLWPLETYALRDVSPASDALRPAGRRFSPLGLDGPLFNMPRTETDIAGAAGEIHLPIALRPHGLMVELDRLRAPAADADAAKPENGFFAKENPVLCIRLRCGTPEEKEIAPENMHIADLRDWRVPAAVDDENKVAIDPVLGRFLFAPGANTGEIRVSYAMAFSGDVGGGAYNRGESAGASPANTPDWQAGVMKGAAQLNESNLFETLSEALAAWSARPPGTRGMISIMDSLTRDEDLDVRIPGDSNLILIAAGWPLTGAVPNLIAGERRPGHIVPEGLRPLLRGRVRVRSTAPPDEHPGMLTLNGLCIQGGISVDARSPAGLSIEHCTVVAGDEMTPSVFLNEPAGRAESAARFRLRAERSILRRIECGSVVADVELRDCIVFAPHDAPEEAFALRAPECRVVVETSTLLGRSEMAYLEAHNSIFAEAVEAKRRQAGCARFSYIPAGSTTPRRFRCQPETALGESSPEMAPSEEAKWKRFERARIAPVFISRTFGDPCFARLSRHCAEEIRTGAQDGAEMGVFNFLKQAQREANLRTVLPEYLRFETQAELIFMGEDT